MGRLTEMVAYLNATPKELKKITFHHYNPKEESKKYRKVKPLKN